MSLKRLKGGRWALAGVWVVVICIGWIANAWIQGEANARRVLEGERSALKAAEAVRRARALEAAGDHRNAAAQQDFAVSLLRGIGGATRGDAFASILLDLVSLKLSDGPESPSARAGARRLLDEAWQVAGTTAPLRARIARELGALEILSGRLNGAEGWYARAQDLDPSDTTAEERLRTLRKTKHARPPPVKDGS